VDRPNQVWCADITYLPMQRGFLYLVAIMDWHTRKVLAWRISNTLEADFCVEALNEAIHKFGPPEIMNTDQGSQFTSFVWTDRLRRSGVRISMDGKGRFLDNIFIERLWRTLKYECVYLHAWETGSEAKAGIRNWMTFYNNKRPHSALGGRSPAVVYWVAMGVLKSVGLNATVGDFLSKFGNLFLNAINRPVTRFGWVCG
jgi:putative transposase